MLVCGSVIYSFSVRSVPSRACCAASCVGSRGITEGGVPLGQVGAARAHARPCFEMAR